MSRDRAMEPVGGPPGFTLRHAVPEDLPRCGRIWRAALNDYFAPLHLALIAADSASVRRLHGHALTTDPGRFIVAERMSGGRARPLGGRGDAASAVVGFAAAVLRGRVWFLSMLFVEPAVQGSGLGRALLERALPPPTERPALSLALTSDSAQPVSNGLYASLGIVARMPAWNLVGRPSFGALPALPDGISAAEDRGASIDPEIGAVDLDVLGFEHPEDHRFVRESGRRRFLYRTGDGRLAGYGYGSPVGHLGPVAVRDGELLAPVLGHLLEAVRPPGASSIWVPGAAGEATSHLVRAGLRLDGFPVLLSWSRAFADFGRYVPHSPGLL